MGLLACLRFLNLSADFPMALDSRGAAFTDEGWWSRNAVAFVREGRWYIDDGYNTVFSLPVLPVLQAFWFKLFGISLTSARAISAVCSLIITGLLYAIARRELSAKTAWLTPFLVLSSYAMFVYSRIALLEMPMLVLLLLSLWLIITAQPSPKTSPPKTNSDSFSKLDRQSPTITSNIATSLKLIGAAVFFGLAVLTKTTALFALPALIGLIYLQVNEKPQLSRKQRLQQVATFVLTLAIPAILYALVSHSDGNAVSADHFSSYNVINKVEFGIIPIIKNPLRVIKHSLVVFPLLFPILFIALSALWQNKAYRYHPLFKISALWTLSAMAAFSLSNYAAPRYFLIWIVPISLAIPLAIEHYWPRISRQKTIFISLLALSVLVSAIQISEYLLTPDYTFVNMAEEIKSEIEENPDHSPVLLGHFADTLALAEDIKAVNDYMGFQPFDYRLEKFDPGYYVRVGPVEPKITDTLEENYNLSLIEKFDVYDNRDFDAPVLFYRLDPK
jgi:hypothetical protein